MGADEAKRRRRIHQMVAVLLLLLSACSRPKPSDSSAPNRCGSLTEFHDFLGQFVDGVPGRQLTIEIAWLHEDGSPTPWMRSTLIRSLHDWDQFVPETGDMLATTQHDRDALANLDDLTGYREIARDCASGTMALTKEGTAWVTDPDDRQMVRYTLTPVTAQTSAPPSH